MPIYVARPAANTEVALFSALSDFYISNIFISNTGVATGTFSVGVRPKGNAVTTWLFFNVTLKKSETFNVTAIAVNSGDTIQVQTSVSDVHFTLTGDGT